MNRNDFRNAFPRTPDHFILRMDSVLEDIESMRMNQRQRRGTARIALIAAVLIVLLAGSAIAIGNAMGVFDFMKRVVEPIVPLEGAEELVEGGLGYAECAYGSVEVTEGIYSGRSCKVTLKVVMKDGYEPSFPELVFLNAENPGAGSLDMAEGENGEVQFMIESILEEDIPEILDCELSMMFGKNGKAFDGVKLNFSLNHAASESAQLVPQNEGERWKILSGSMTRNEFSMVFDIEFEYTAETGEDMGVDIRAFNMDGEQFTGGDTSYGNRGLPVIGETMVCRQIQEIQSTEEMPETIIFKPKVIGEDKWLDEIICAIQ